MSVRNLRPAALTDLSRSDLVELWEANYGTAPPKGISRRLMLLAVAYGRQAAERGVPKPALARRLTRLATEGPIGAPGSPSPRTPARTLASGTRLMREWNGVAHVVDVVEGGYMWNGERYRSLSAVARAITGARWSGPRFFGTGS